MGLHILLVPAGIIGSFALLFLAMVVLNYLFPRQLKKESEVAEDALLVYATETPDDEWFIHTSPENMTERIYQFYQPLEAEIRKIASGPEMEVESLEALASWIIRGPKARIAALRRANSPLRALPLYVPEKATITVPWTYAS